MTHNQRNGWWWCDYSVGGVRRRELSGTRDREEALNVLRRKEGKLASGEMIAACGFVIYFDAPRKLRYARGRTGIHCWPEGQVDSESEARGPQSSEADDGADYKGFIRD